jgi:formylglycine-generating enzyme required for sulfatase activity
MNPIARQKVVALVARFGRDICDDPQRCEALLRDVCGDQHQREVFVLVAAVKNRAASELADGASSVPIEVLVAKLSARLYNSLGIREDLARWSIESWAVALGKLAENPKTPARASIPPRGDADAQYRGGTNGMVLIPGGSFAMGNSIGDADITDAVPVTANVSAFYMDANLVTWSQWQGVYAYAISHGYGLNAGAGKAANHPVQSVSWYDCVKWCNARSQQAGKVPVYYTDAGLTKVYTNGEVPVYVSWGAKGYRLPTEAEWEKAARGGLSGQRFPWGNRVSQTNANYNGGTSGYGYDLGPDGYNSIGSIGGTDPATSPVGSFAANGYGLYDMAGNVCQWCWDWYGTAYAGGTDPRGVATGSYRVLRGGSWGRYACGCRAACRSYYGPSGSYDYFGFRSVLPPGQ